MSDSHATPEGRVGILIALSAVIIIIGSAVTVSLTATFGLPLENPEKTLQASMLPSYMPSSACAGVATLEMRGVNDDHTNVKWKDVTYPASCASIREALNLSARPTHESLNTKLTTIVEAVEWKTNANAYRLTNAEDETLKLQYQKTGQEEISAAALLSGGLTKEEAETLKVEHRNIFFLDNPGSVNQGSVTCSGTVQGNLKVDSEQKQGPTGEITHFDVSVKADPSCLAQLSETSDVTVRVNEERLVTLNGTVQGQVRGGLTHVTLLQDEARVDSNDATLQALNGHPLLASHDRKIHTLVGEWFEVKGSTLPGEFYVTFEYPVKKLVKISSEGQVLAETPMTETVSDFGVSEATVGSPSLKLITENSIASHSLETVLTTSAHEKEAAYTIGGAHTSNNMLLHANSMLDEVNSDTFARTRRMERSGRSDGAVMEIPHSMATYTVKGATPKPEYVVCGEISNAEQCSRIRMNEDTLEEKKSFANFGSGSVQKSLIAAGGKTLKTYLLVKASGGEQALALWDTANQETLQTVFSLARPTEDVTICGRNEDKSASCLATLETISEKKSVLSAAKATDLTSYALASEIKLPFSSHVTHAASSEPLRDIELQEEIVCGDGVIDEGETVFTCPEDFDTSAHNGYISTVGNNIQIQDPSGKILLTGQPMYFSVLDMKRRQDGTFWLAEQGQNRVTHADATRSGVDQMVTRYIFPGLSGPFGVSELSNDNLIILSGPKLVSGAINALYKMNLREQKPPVAKSVIATYSQIAATKYVRMFKVATLEYLLGRDKYQMVATLEDMATTAPSTVHVVWRDLATGETISDIATDLMIRKTGDDIHDFSIAFLPFPYNHPAELNVGVWSYKDCALEIYSTGGLIRKIDYKPLVTNVSKCPKSGDFKVDAEARLIVGERYISSPVSVPNAVSHLWIERVIDVSAPFEDYYPSYGTPPFYRNFMQILRTVTLPFNKLTRDATTFRNRLPYVYRLPEPEIIDLPPDLNKKVSPPPGGILPQ